MADTVTITNKTHFSENNYKTWFCDASWTGDAGDIVITGVPFRHVAMVLVLPMTGTWATAPSCADLDLLTTEGSLPITGCPVTAAATARIFIWGY